jgi:lipopolysaccharide transport system ATP-binding protein
VKRYSSGMYVRLAFAVAAHLEPEILIVDEVLAVGDAAFQRKCLGKMGEVASDGRTVLFVSHNPAAIRQLCDSVVLFDSGQLIARGMPEPLLAHYLHTSTSNSSPARAERHGLEMRDVFVNGVRDTDSERKTAIFFDEEYRIVVKLRARDGFQQCAIVVEVRDDMGVLVSSLCSVEEGIDPFDFEGDCTVAFSLRPIQLYPGRYTGTVLVYRPHDETRYLEARDAFSFEVQPKILHNAMWAYAGHHGFARMSESAALIEG